MVRKKNKITHLDYSVQDDGRLRQAQLKMHAMLAVVDDICVTHGIDYWLDRGTLLGAVRHKGFIPWDDDIDISMPRSSFETFLRIAPALLPKDMWLQTMHTDPGYFNLAAPLKIRDLNSRFIEKHEQGNEPYQQGIFLDVFVYDTVPEAPMKRRMYKFLGKKIWRLLGPKYSATAMGRHASVYKALGFCVPKSWLNYGLLRLIQKANRSNSPLLGYGYDSTKSNFLRKEDIYPLKRMEFETTTCNVVNREDVMLKQIYGDYMCWPPKHKRKLNHCRELKVEVS